MISVHADVVGSLLRPPWLLEARDRRAAGLISDVEFNQVENRAVDEAVALQEEVGLQIVTDGEMRRLSFQSQMTEAVEGFGEWDLGAFLWGEWFGDAAVGDWTGERPAGMGAVGKLRRVRPLSVGEFTYLSARTTHTPKVTLPSPGLFSNFWSRTRSREAYPTLDRFLADVVDILREEVSELVRRGATYIQLDAPHYPLLLNRKTRAFYEGQGWTVDRWLEHGIELENVVMDAPGDVTFGLHL